MRIVVALGGNALLHRGEPLTAENQLNNIKQAATHIAKLIPGNQIVITHGNGPQVGLLALQSEAYRSVKSYPLDVLNAETEGMIGYLLEQEISNRISMKHPVVTLLTRVVVDAEDPAFKKPTKPIGPVYTKEEAEYLAKEKQWNIAPDGKGYRRVVASPQPQRVIGIDPILWLLAHGAIVIAAGGGGIPVVINDEENYVGVEAVIDKDFCSAELAKTISADCLIIATDVDAIYLDWGKPTQRAIHETTPEELDTYSFPEGSMSPKVRAACQFVKATQKPAIIGALQQIDQLVQGKAGTHITFKGINR